MPQPCEGPSLSLHLLCISSTSHHHWVWIKILLSITDCQVVCSGVCPMQMTGRNLENIESRRNGFGDLPPSCVCILLSAGTGFSADPAQSNINCVSLCPGTQKFSLITRDTAFQAIMRCSNSAMGKGRSVEVMGGVTSTVVPCGYPRIGNQGKTKIPSQSCKGGRWCLAGIQFPNSHNAWQELNPPSGFSALSAFRQQIWEITHLMFPMSSHSECSWHTKSSSHTLTA